MKLRNEIWKDIPEYSNYQVSSLGNNYCDTYIDVRYNTTALTAFLEAKIKDIKNERAR